MFAKARPLKEAVSLEWLPCGGPVMFSEETAAKLLKYSVRPFTRDIDCRFSRIPECRGSEKRSGFRPDALERKCGTRDIPGSQWAEPAMCHVPVVRGMSPEQHARALMCCHSAQEDRVFSRRVTDLLYHVSRLS